jgi:hypothetical protein
VDLDADDVTNINTLADDMDTKYGPRTGAHNLRPRKQPSFAHLHTIAHTADVVPSESIATGQMSMQRGIKEFGSAGLAAVSKEMKQLHDREVMAAKDPTELTQRGSRISHVPQA